jgi:hypothetical protein
MKASVLVDVKTKRLLAENAGMDYRAAMNPCARLEPGLKAGVCADGEAEPTPEELKFAELQDPVTAETISEILSRTRQAHRDRSIHLLSGPLGLLARVPGVSPVRAGAKSGKSRGSCCAPKRVWRPKLAHS